jgi:hypothetical protein
LNRRTWQGALMAGVALAAPAPAQEPVEPAPASEQDRGLAARVDQLEEEVSSLRAQLDDATVRESESDEPGIAFNFYGYVKLDSAYDSARTSVGNFARWVESEDLNPNDNQFSMTANETRLGVDFLGPPEGAWRTGGRVEIDFYGGGTENKPTPYLRHAFLDLVWPESGWTLLAGQTWDVISPLVMPTVNYTAGWWQGNIGYRRPQVRVAKDTRVSESTELKLALAASRTITGRTQGFAPDGDTGSDVGFPTVQARVGLGSGATGGGLAEVGLSGHYGQEERDLDASGTNVKVETWSLNLDARVRVSERVVLRGELHKGENLDSYLGGIGQGINTATGEVIATHGAWLAGSIRASELWDVNLGLAFEDPDDANLVAGDRKRNQVYFVNTWRRLGTYTQLALEVSYLETDYVGQSAGNSLRTQFAFVYRF